MENVINYLKMYFCNFSLKKQFIFPLTGLRGKKGVIFM